MMIGVVQEPVFGPLVVFRSGGSASEVLDDQVARLTPLTDADAEEMINSVHAARCWPAAGARRRWTPPGSRMRCCGFPGSLMISRR